MSNVKNMLDTNKEIVQLTELLSGGVEGQSEETKNMTSDFLFSSLGSILENSNNKGLGEPSVFSLFSKGCSDGDETTEIKKLEDRLTNLEKILGASSEAIYTLDAMTVIEFLTTRLNVLGDPAKIYALEQQAMKLDKELANQSLNKRIQPILARQRIAKVEEMFELMSTWDKAAEQLPTVIDRLKKLQQLNMEASGVVEQVNTLREQQSELSKILMEDRQLLQSVSKSLVSSTEKIQGSMKSLDSRIAKLTS